MNYAEFLARKQTRVQKPGRDIGATDVHPMLHDWQNELVRWAVRTGRAAIWADTGLGKTMMQLEWARLSADVGLALVVAPLAVCQQTVREAAKLGINAQYVRTYAGTSSNSVEGVGLFDAVPDWANIDPAASKVLAHRFHGVPNLGDITQIDWDAVEPVDVLCGGFPCQDVSAAGRRAGIKDGTRSGLWAVFADAIAALKPRVVVVENVKGLLSAEAHRNVESVDPVMGDGPGRPVLRAAGAVLGDLSDLGYNAQWTTVSAASVGAPHRRERVFIVARPADATFQPGGVGNGDDVRVRGGARRQSPTAGRGSDAAHPPGDGWHEGWPESAGLVGGSDAPQRGDGPVDLLPTPAACRSGNNQSPSPGAAVRPSLDMITALLPTPSCADGGGGHLTRSGARGDELLLPGIARAYGNGELLPTPNAQDGNGGRFNSDGHQTTLPGTVRELLPTPRRSDGAGGANPLSRPERQDDVETRIMRLLPTPAASGGSGGGRHPDARAGHTSQIIDTALLHGTPQWGKYEPAIRRWEQVTRPAPSPTELNRNGNPRLNPEFSEWMMGWPDGWVTAIPGISRNDQLRCIGNGVVPQQAVAALSWLLAVSGVAA